MDKSIMIYRTSQLTNTGNFLLAIIITLIGFFTPEIISKLPHIDQLSGNSKNIALVFILIGISYAFWSFLVVQCKTYQITLEELIYTHGVINQDIDPIELYRVKDAGVSRPILLRIFGLGNVTIYSSDKTLPQLELSAVKSPKEIAAIIRLRVEKMRTAKGVREFD